MRVATSSRQIPLNLNLTLPLARCGDFPRRLHPQRRVHLHPEGLLDPERHFGRETAVLVDEDR